jgi:GT2 family glycosyltransferase
MNWILVPLRNNLHYIRKALPTFLAQDIGDVHLLLMSNGCSDGTAAWANSLRNDRVTYVYNVQPLSVAASWNRMLRWTFKQGAEYALVVNADVELRPDAYRHLVADGGLFVTAVGTDDKSKIAPQMRMHEDQVGVFGGNGMFESYEDPDPANKRPHPDFSCYLIRKECFERVGPFNEECLGGYAEDSFAHVAMHRAGIEAVCLDLPFYHVGAGTLKNADPKEAKRIRENADRNRALFKAKYGVEVGSAQYYDLFQHGAPE